MVPPYLKVPRCLGTLPHMIYRAGIGLNIASGSAD